MLTQETLYHYVTMLTKNSFRVFLRGKKEKLLPGLHLFWLLRLKLTFRLMPNSLKYLMAINLKLMVDMAHLSKRPSDLKQNDTQEKTPFSDTVFNTHSHGVVNFVASVSPKN